MANVQKKYYVDSYKLIHNELCCFSGAEGNFTYDKKSAEKAKELSKKITKKIVELEKKMPYKKYSVNISTCRKYNEFVDCYYENNDEDGERILSEIKDDVGCSCCCGLQPIKGNDGQRFEKIEKINNNYKNKNLVEYFKILNKN